MYIQLILLKKKIIIILKLGDFLIIGLYVT